MRDILQPYKIVDNMSLPGPSVPKINCDKPSSVQEGGVNAFLKNKNDGSKGD
jgi:hypothetical protein